MGAKQGESRWSVAGMSYSWELLRHWKKPIQKQWQMSLWTKLKRPLQDRVAEPWAHPGTALGHACRWDTAPHDAQALLPGASHSVLLFACRLQVHPRGLVGLHGYLWCGDPGANSQVPGAPVLLSVRGWPACWRMWRTQAGIPASLLCRTVQRGSSWV